MTHYPHINLCFSARFACNPVWVAHAILKSSVPITHRLKCFKSFQCRTQVHNQSVLALFSLLLPHSFTVFYTHLFPCPSLAGMPYYSPFEVPKILLLFQRQFLALITATEILCQHSHLHALIEGKGMLWQFAIYFSLLSLSFCLSLWKTSEGRE